MTDVAFVEVGIREIDSIAASNRTSGSFVQNFYGNLKKPSRRGP
jgi:hypothetical protein